MKVLVTGASGFVGRALVEELLSRGFSVRAVYRSSYSNTVHSKALKTLSKQKKCEYDEFFLNEINEDTNWDGAFDYIDVVIHLAARVHVMDETATNSLEAFRKVNVAGTKKLFELAANSKVRRFVFLSSIKVNGEHTVTPFSELDEAKPLDAYGVSKWEAEQVLQDLFSKVNMGLTIIRPPLIYGFGVKGNFEKMISAIKAQIPLPLANINNKRSLIGIDNLTDVLIFCAMNTKADGQTYLVSDGEDVSTPNLIKAVAMAMGAPVRIFSCPLILLKIIAFFTGKTMQLSRLSQSLQVNSSKIRLELGWVPPNTFRESMERLLKSDKG